MIERAGARADKTIDNQPIESMKINNKRKNQSESVSLEDDESKVKQLVCV